MTDANHTPRRTVRVPDNVWQPAQEKAAERGETLSSAINGFLEDYGQGLADDFPEDD